MTTLEEYLLGEYEAPQEIPDDPETQEQMKERFRIQDDSQANWAIRKIEKIRGRRANAHALAEREIRRIQEWLEDQDRTFDREESFFTNLLHDYHSRILDQDPKRKTIKLPAGKLQMRQAQPEFMRDDDKILAWLKANDKTEYIAKVERLAWSELKKRVEVTPDYKAVVDGEVMDGVIVMPRPASFKVVTREEDEGDAIPEGD